MSIIRSPIVKLPSVAPTNYYLYIKLSKNPIFNLILNQQKIKTKIRREKRSVLFHKSDSEYELKKPHRPGPKTTSRRNRLAGRPHPRLARIDHYQRRLGLSITDWIGATDHSHSCLVSSSP